MKISVVIPAYNEEELIEKTLSTYLDFLDENFKSYEFIVVNDGSTDSTVDIVKRFKEVILISYSQNRGKGYAVKRGILRATGDYIFFTDADLSFSPLNILSAMNIFKVSNTCGVIGVRKNKNHDYPFFRRVASDVFSHIVQFLLKTKVCDTQCGFKAFDKKTAKLLFSMSHLTNWGFDFEIIYLSEQLGKTIKELPLSFVHHKKEKSNVLLNSFSMLKDVISLKFRNEAYNEKQKN